MGRLSLAAVCALAGFAYGALLDFSVMFGFGGEQSLDRYLAISARGLPFNIAHAAGNAALALVAGPAMVRMLLRYRRRFEFAWKPAPGGPAGRGGDRRRGLPDRRPAGRHARRSSVARGPMPPGAAPRAASAWLRGAQNGDGGFGFARGEESSPAMTGWAVLGLEAAGVNPLDVDHGDATPITYLAGDGRPDQHHRRHRAHDPAPARRRARTPATSRATTWSAGCSRAGAATAPGPSRSTRPPSGSSP